MMYIFLVLLLLVISIYIFFLQPQFGKLPKGKTLGQTRLSPNYKNGLFQICIKGERQGVNVITPMIGEAVKLDNPNNKSKWWESV